MILLVGFKDGWYHIILEALYILEGLGDESVVFGTERYETKLLVELLKVDMASHRCLL